MALRIECLTIDCCDLGTVTSFWEQALGYERVYEDDYEIALGVPGASGHSGHSRHSAQCRRPAASSAGSPSR